MNLIEKIYAIFALLFALALVCCLILIPELRYLDKLVPLCIAGLVINVGLMFVVLKDIFYRPFPDTKQRYFWVFVVLFFWPAIIIYLPKYGFKPRLTL